MGRKAVPDRGRLNRERLVTKALEFPFCTERVFSLELGWRVQDGVYTERQDDRYGVRVPSRMKGKGGYLEKYAFFYWEPVKFFEKWCNMFMFAFAKNDFGCIILKFLKAVHSIRSDVSE